MTLPAGELRTGRDRPIRLEGLEAEIATRSDDSGGSVDEARAFEDRERLHRDVELETVERRAECGVPVLRVALDGRGGHPEAPEIGGQLTSLQCSLGRAFRPVALSVELWDRTDVLGRRTATTGDHNAKDEEQTPGPHPLQASEGLTLPRC